MYAIPSIAIKRAGAQSNKHPIVLRNCIDALSNDMLRTFTHFRRDEIIYAGEQLYSGSFEKAALCRLIQKSSFMLTHPGEQLMPTQPGEQLYAD